MSRILALDYGRKRTGVALSDALGLTAQPCESWCGLDWPEMVLRIQQLIQTKDVAGIVVGYPLTLSGQRKKMAREAERFVLMLRKALSTPVWLWDERLTSVAARKSMNTSKKAVRMNKMNIDQCSAVLLLQNYLDYQSGFSTDMPKGGV